MHYVIVPLPDYGTEADAHSFADDVNLYLQPHHAAFVLEADTVKLAPFYRAVEIHLALEALEALDR
jgi:hypothetical protein